MFLGGEIAKSMAAVVPRIGSGVDGRELDSHQCFLGPMAISGDEKAHLYRPGSW
jgi:hypothetical protein